METTNPKKLRAELRDYLDLASKEPIRIHRRSGESFILLKEDLYATLQNEIVSLQRQLLGMSNILDGKTTEYKIGERAALLKRLKKKA